MAYELGPLGIKVKLIEPGFAETDFAARSFVLSTNPQGGPYEPTVSALLAAFDGMHLIIHTDQGSQYRASDYHKLLRKHEISCSMSAKGCCWDNAVVESSFLPSNLNLTSMTMPEPYSILLRSRGH